MRVNVLLPDFAREPVGGLKVQYEFANRLSDLGHDVAIYHSVNLDRRVLANPRSIPGLLRWNVIGSRALTWFELRPSVRCLFLPQILPALIRSADATLFNAFMIADKLPPGGGRFGRLVEVVYEYPVWATGTPELRAHLARSLRRDDVAHVATSIAVEQMLGEIGVVPVAKITCGIELPAAGSVPGTEVRDRIVAFPLRNEAHKGAADVLAALPLIRERSPEVSFECFGRYRDESAIPPFATFHGYLDDNELGALYRRAQVFVLPSHAEGWGLPAAEAMAHGAAVVVADNGGSSDFAIDGETAIVVPAGDPVAIAEAVTRLVTDAALRSRLVARAMERCAAMGWDEPTTRLVQLLEGR